MDLEKPSLRKKDSSNKNYKCNYLYKLHLEKGHKMTEVVLPFYAVHIYSY